jgi:uncharacterized membrane protein YoaK (UPF0700 family)
MTLVTGLVDAFSYLVLGHVFVANMTGNIVFLGFAAAGAGGVSLTSSAVAVSAFGVGALLAARLHTFLRLELPDLLGVMTSVEFVLAVIAIAVGVLPGVAESPTAYGIVALLAAAMGVQSATTSRLQISGFNSTVVLTTMLSTLAAASRSAGGSGLHNGRRMLAIFSMFAGGLVGALLALRVNRLGPLVLAAAVLAVVSLATRAVASRLQD